MNLDFRSTQAIKGARDYKNASHPRDTQAADEQATSAPAQVTAAAGAPSAIEPAAPASEPSRAA